MQRTSNIDLVPFDTEKHLPTLRRWLNQPHVRRWWGDPKINIEEAMQRPKGGGHVLISIDGTPAGYLCWQPYRKQDLKVVGLTDLEDGSIDVDIMIGEIAHVGHGVGPRALELLLARLGGDLSVPLVGVCTSVENARAIRAFEKVGFSRLREYDDDEWGRCCFMVVRPR